MPITKSFAITSQKIPQEVIGKFVQNSEIHISALEHGQYCIALHTDVVLKIRENKEELRKWQENLHFTQMTRNVFRTRKGEIYMKSHSCNLICLTDL